jgi:hypothetical protein
MIYQLTPLRVLENALDDRVEEHIIEEVGLQYPFLMELECRVLVPDF